MYRFWYDYINMEKKQNYVASTQTAIQSTRFDTLNYELEKS